MVSLGHLVAGIAHEINTPIGVALTAVSYFGERTNALAVAFKSNTLKRNELRQYVALARKTAEMIAYNIGRAAQLIQSFKQVAIDQTGELQRSFDLAVFLEQLIRYLQDIRKAGLTLELICADGITKDSFPGALGQVITNLVHNVIIHAYDRAAEVRSQSPASYCPMVGSDCWSPIPAMACHRRLWRRSTTRSSPRGAAPVAAALACILFSTWYRSA